MAVFFFDCSAIVKAYVNEVGTTWVKSITDPGTGNRIYVAEITGVEVVSAISRQARGGSLSVGDASIAIAQFRHDFTHQFIRVDIDSTLIMRAMLLAETHFLRGYDAVQLAAALKIHDERVSLRMSLPTLISSDTSLNNAALAEVMIIDDPNAHP